MLLGQIRNARQGVGANGGEQLGGRVATEQFERPTGRDVLDQHGEFGKGVDEQLVQLIDEARALPDAGLKPAGDLANLPQFGRREFQRGGSFVERVARRRAGFERIGLVGTEQSGAIVFVALRIAAGDGEGRSFRARRVRKGLQEVQQVVGVLTGGIETNVEVNAAVLRDDAIEPPAQFGIAGRVLGEGEFGGGRLQVGTDEGSVVSVTRGVDADTNADGFGRERQERIRRWRIRRLARGRTVS